MVDSWKILLYEYMLHKRSYLDNDYVQLINNVSFRDCDMLDHLEFIVARTKLDLVDEIFFDLSNLFKL